MNAWVAETNRSEQSSLYLIKFQNAEQGAADLAQANISVVQRYSLLPDVVAVSLTPPQMHQWNQHPNVLYLEVDSMVSMRSYGFEETIPALQQIRAAQLHEKQIVGAGVKVALLDTGINTQSQRVTVAGGVSFVREESDFGDHQGHGTAMAGVIGMQHNNEASDGAVGVAPQVELYAVKVLNRQGIGNVSAVIEGLTWAVEQGMHIATLCFGTLRHSSTLEEALDMALMRGLLLIAPTGNIGAVDGVDVPARYRAVIAVGAVDAENRLAPFSNQGPEVELVAPGVSVRGLYLQDLPLMQSGTSLSAAYVAGAAALLKSNNPSLSAQELRHLLVKSATALGERSPYGYGLVNAFGALQAEPNTAPAIALTLEIGETRMGSLASKEQVDAYKFMAAQSEALEVTLDVPVGCDYDLYVFDAQMKLIGTSTRGTGVTERVLVSARASETYILHIFGYSETFDVTAGYTLQVNAVTNASVGDVAGVAGATLVSNTMLHALPLAIDQPLNATLQSAQDTHWYQIELCADDVIEVELGNIPSGTDYDFELYDATETRVGRSVTLSSSLKIVTFEATETGTYYLKIFSNDHFDASRPYSLHLDRYTCLSGVITENRTLTAEAGPYFIGNGGLTLAPGVVLDLAAGTILNVRSQNPVRVQAGATLNLIGTADNPIVILGAATGSQDELWPGLQRETNEAQVNHQYMTVHCDTLVSPMTAANFAWPVEHAVSPTLTPEETTRITDIPPTERPAAIKRWYQQASPYNLSIWDPLTFHMQDLYYGIDVEIFARWEVESNRANDERYAKGDVNYWEFVNARFMRDIADAERLVAGNQTASHYRVQRLVDYLKSGRAWTSKHGLLKLNTLYKLLNGEESSTFYPHLRAMSVSFWLSHNTSIIYWNKRARERDVWQAETLTEAHFVNGVIIRLDFSADMPFSVPPFGTNTPPIGLIGFLLHRGPFKYPEQYPAPPPPPIPPGLLDYDDETTFQLVRMYLNYLLHDGTTSVFTWWLPTPSDREISTLLQQKGLTLASTPDDWKREILVPAWKSVEELEAKYLQDEATDSQVIHNEVAATRQ